MSPRQFAEWAAMERHAPLPRPWITNALLCMIHNRIVRTEAYLTSDKKLVNQMIDPADFMPAGERDEKKTRSIDQWRQFFEGMVADGRHRNTDG